MPHPGCRCEEMLQGLMRADPDLLREDAYGRERGAHQHGGPRRARCAAAPVESANNHRSRATKIDRHGDLLEHENEVADFYGDTENEPKYGHAQDRKAKPFHVFCGRQRLFITQRENDVLYKNTSPRVEQRAIKTDIREEHDGKENAQNAMWQEISQGDRELHLVPLGCRTDLGDFAADMLNLDTEVVVL